MRLQFLYQTGERKKKQKTKTQNKQKPKQTTKVQLSILTNLSSRTHLDYIWTAKYV